MSEPQFRFDDEMQRVWFAHECTQIEGELLESFLPNSKWMVTQREPLTVSPSIHCAKPEGCGLHGWIRDGKWVDA